VIAKQGEGSEWVTGEQRERRKSVMNVIEMFQYENIYLPIV
jgi:hypothetical protein